MALESLGPIFVKFGQILSTRRDLLPPAIAEELARLQDRVPPFPSGQAVAELESAYGRPVDRVFAFTQRDLTTPLLASNRFCSPFCVFAVNTANQMANLL